MRNYLSRMTSLLCSLFVLWLALPVVALAEGENDPLWNRPSYEKKVFDIGQRILAANGITERIAFRMERADDVNAYAQRGGGLSNTITIERGLLALVSSDDELAAVVSHEIAHITCRHHRRAAVKKTLLKTGAIVAIGTAAIASGGLIPPATMLLAKPAIRKTGQPYESEADLVGLDYLVKAGYNPVAMETMMTKITGDSTAATAFFSSHPMGTKRIGAIHQKIATRYPQFLTPEAAANPIPGSPYLLQPKSPDAPPVNAATAQPTGAAPSQTSAAVQASPKSTAVALIPTSPTNPQGEAAKPTLHHLPLPTPESPPVASPTNPTQNQPAAVPEASTKNLHSKPASSRPASAKTTSANRPVKPDKPKKVNYQTTKADLVNPPKKIQTIETKPAQQPTSATSDGTGNTVEAPNAQSVAQLLLDLPPDHLLTLKLISRTGYLSRKELQEQFDAQSPEATQIMLNELIRKKLIRQLGSAPDELYVLSEWATQALAPSKTP